MLDTDASKCKSINFSAALGMLRIWLRDSLLVVPARDGLYGYILIIHPIVMYYLSFSLLSPLPIVGFARNFRS